MLGPTVGEHQVDDPASAKISSPCRDTPLAASDRTLTKPLEFLRIPLDASSERSALRFI